MWPSDPAPAGPVGDQLNPVDVPFLVAHRWLMDVKTWELDVNINWTTPAPDSGAIIASGLVSWNTTNFYGASGTNPGAPSAEKYLGLGWQIENFVIAGTDIVTVDFFRSAYGNSGLVSGCGMEYDIPANVTKPFFRIFTGLANGTTSRSGTSAVVCTVDGILVPFDDIVPFVNTGTIDFYPHEYWEYRDGGGIQPMYNASTGAPILPRQTDELP